MLMLVAAYPGLSVVIPFSLGAERFSEFWVLGPTHMVKDYPFDIVVGEQQHIFVGVGNHLGRSAYYIVFVKLRSQTQAAPTLTASTPSPLSPLYEFRVVVADGDSWETPVAFSFLEASRFGDLSVVSKISINDAIFAVEGLAVWDPDNMGFYYQLFFELWIYDTSVSDFQYHDRFVGIWLNMTV